MMDDDTEWTVMVMVTGGDGSGQLKLLNMYWVMMLAMCYLMMLIYWRMIVERQVDDGVV